ncbi:alginate export family protein [Thermomonas sp.]|uniref:alginate export family protein n=1 Tax=Thermomonas sp. TaxID=1971895 RepID=UPI00248A7012|nr:alginate export family protein [Thermomonas sp.]MDI1252793.1 alginate export family protein [Thermomonas sp.]
MAAISRVPVLLCLVCLPLVATAQSVMVDPTWNLRLRHEQVDDGAFARDAIADTLRLRAGLHFAFPHGWSALLEGEGIASAGNHYNSGANGRTAYPAVIDPSGAELNQSWIAWNGAKGAAKFGRQRILIDNQRWVGNVGWRQNEQTFDALSLEYKPIAGLTLRYDWLDRVHRVSGDDARDPLARERNLESHLFNAAWKHGTQQVVGYACLHHDQDVASASTSTYGLRWTGDRLRDGNGWGWTAEAANQRNYSTNPLHFSHSYWLLEPAYNWHGTSFKAGWEHLGGNGSHALQTPLATLHAFNGWDDKFLATPAGGLNDRYLSASGKFGHIRDGRFAWALAWHDYRADTALAGFGHYGSEWNASLGFPLATRVQALLKIADYRADRFARDTTKVWLQVEWASAK